jgi:hypothetical protein
MFTALMVHQIDIAHRILNLDHPAEATSIGDDFAAKGLWQTPYDGWRHPDTHGYCDHLGRRHFNDLCA